MTTLFLQTDYVSLLEEPDVRISMPTVKIIVVSLNYVCT